MNYEEKLYKQFKVINLASLISQKKYDFIIRTRESMSITGHYNI